MNIDGWLKDLVVVQSEECINDYGDPVWSDKRRICARVEKRSQLVVGIDGNETRSEDVMTTVDQIKQTDRLWLPGDDCNDDNLAKRPIDIRTADTKVGELRLYETRL